MEIQIARQITVHMELYWKERENGREKMYKRGSNR